MTAAVSLRAALAKECSKCEFIEVAWCAPKDVAFTLQGVIHKRWRTDKHWRLLNLIYVDSAQMRAINAVYASILSQFHDVDGSVVSYLFRPGEGWTEAYRRTAKVQNDA